MAVLAFLCLYFFAPIRSAWREETDPETGYLMLINVGSTETGQTETTHITADPSTASLDSKLEDDCIHKDELDIQSDSIAETLTLIGSPLSPCNETNSCIDDNEETPESPNLSLSNSTSMNSALTAFAFPRRRYQRAVRQRLRIKAQKLKSRENKLNETELSIPIPVAPAPTSSPTTPSPTISMERLDKGISCQNRKNRKAIKSSNETDDDILRQHLEQQRVLMKMKSDNKKISRNQPHKTQHNGYHKGHNRTTVALYGLISSQRNLHSVLHNHLLATKKSNLFVSMIQVPDTALPAGVTSKKYWAHYDDVLETLTEILANPKKWCNVKDMKDLMIHTLNYFVVCCQNKEEVNKLVTSMEETYANKSQEHHRLCQDIRYSILLFRRIDERSMDPRSDGRLFGVKLRITIDTIDLVTHWWATALCAILRRMNGEVKWLLEDTKYGAHYQAVTPMHEMSRTLQFFTHHSERIVPKLDEYSQFIGKSLIDGKGTRFEFITKACELGITIHAHFQIIASMKIHWLIAMHCFDWIHQGNAGEITVIVPCEESMTLINTLLRDIGIHEEDQMIIRVEQKMQVERVRDDRKKRSTGKARKLKEVVTFKMAQIELVRANDTKDDDEVRKVVESLGHLHQGWSGK